MEGGAKKEAGKVRLVALAADKWLEEIPEVPSVKELGFAGGVMERIVMAPRKTFEDRLVILRQAFRKLYDNKTFKNMMGKLGENMQYMDGPDYEKLRAEQKKQYTELVERITGEKIEGK